jgi:hypothetical protein
MSDETQAKIVLALGDAVDSLIEQAERQLKVTQGVLSTGSEAIKAVSLAGNEHRALAKELPRQVQEAIKDALDGAAIKAAEILSSRFTNADEQAKLAADRYEKAARKLHWKLVVACAIAWSATIALVVLYMNEEIRTLREDSRMLKTTMAYLKQKPQGAQLTLCNPGKKSQYLCVYESPRVSRRPLD